MKKLAKRLTVIFAAGCLIAPISSGQARFLLRKVDDALDVAVGYIKRGEVDKSVFKLLRQAIEKLDEIKTGVKKNYVNTELGPVSTKSMEELSEIEEVIDPAIKKRAHKAWELEKQTKKLLKEDLGEKVVTLGRHD